MTSSERDLLDAVLARPGEEGPRRRLAEALRRRGDPQGEFIEAQLQIAALFRQEDLEAEFARLSRLETKLLREHGAAWARAVAPHVKKHRFQRGFPEIVTLEARSFLAKAEAVYRAAPVVHLGLDGAAGALKEICRSPHLDRVLALELFNQKLTDADAIALSESEHLRALRWLDVGVNGIGMAGLEALVASPRLPSLRWVNFAGNKAPDPCDRAGGVDGEYVATFEKSEIGAELERRFGPRRWLHWQPNVASLMRPPSSVFIGP